MKLRFHLFLLALLAIGVSLLFLDEPRFGDDFTYWYHAFNLHERGMDAWSKNSFHQIRWPVWGVCWVLQGIFALAGFLVPALFLVALIFGGMWGYATIKGASLDARNARLASEADTANGD